MKSKGQLTMSVLAGELESKVASASARLSPIFAGGHENNQLFRAANRGIAEFLGW